MYKLKFWFCKINCKNNTVYKFYRVFNYSMLKKKQMEKTKKETVIHDLRYRVLDKWAI